MATPVKQARVPVALQETGFAQTMVEALSAAHDEPAWMRQRRLEAWAAYEGSALPFWRHTPLDGLNLEEFRTHLEPEEAGWPEELQALIATEEGRGGVFVQRNTTPAFQELSPDLAAQGVILTDLHSAVREYPDLMQRYFMTEAVPPTQGKFEALHGALWGGGLFLYVPRNVNVELPVLTTFWVDEGGLATFPHVLIVAEEGSSITCIEECRSPDGLAERNLVAGVVEVHVGPGAQVRYIALQDWATNAWNFTTYRALCQRDGFISWTFGVTGGGLSRTFVESRLVGDGSGTELLGAYLIGESQHLEMDTVMNHLGRFTTGDLLFKGVLKERARAVFQGLIKIHPGAQDTNAYLSDQTLLLSDEARADSIPSLEIEANEVRASHGATVSQIDEDQIFYLMTRGLSRPEAVRIIVMGFMQPVMDRVPLESVVEKLHAALDRKMATGLGE